jgi:trigger factor
VSTTETNEVRREIEVEIPADVVARETDSVVQKYQKMARLPGFRRGKVPPSIIRQRFADDLKSEVIEALVPRFFREATEKQGLHPVSQPQVTDLHLEAGEPLRFKASFEVLPDFEVSDYKELRAERPDTSVSDEEVEQALTQLRERQATFTNIEDRSLQRGDFAGVSLDGVPTAAGEAGADAPQPVHMDDVLVEIGGANTLSEFSEQLQGVSPGETRTFDVVYPQDFSDERLQGKTFTYTVKVNSIKEKHLPEANDEFAKQVGEFASFDELKNSVRERLQESKKREAEREAKDKLVDQLVQRHNFDVPESLVDHQIDLRLDRGLRALAAQGMRPEDMKKMDFARLRAGQRPHAVNEVKASLLLEKIADAEKIEVSDDEVNREVEAIAAQARQPVEPVRARLTREGGLDRIRARLRNEKTLDFLYRQSA